MTDTNSLSTGAVVLRSNDPRCEELVAAGYAVVAESWGARLLLGVEPDLDVFKNLVDRAQKSGFTVRELRPTDARSVWALEEITSADYPITPATPHEMLTLQQTHALWDEGKRVFGAFHGFELVAVTVVSSESGEERAETDFTSVHPQTRRRGIGAAVKAASILALAAEGVRVFGTGGAAVNEASLAVNSALGYTITEHWLSLMPPEPSEACSRHWVN